jgi:hypothetical protein
VRTRLTAQPGLTARRTIRYAEAKGKVGRNVAALIDTPNGTAGRRRRPSRFPRPRP